MLAGGRGRAFSMRMKSAVFEAGLGDVIRVIYQYAAYRMLCEAREPVPVIVASHNPYAIEIFRLHRNARNFVLYDLGHKYEEFLTAGLRGGEISRALCDFAGVPFEPMPLSGSAGGHVPQFDAPDDIPGEGHIVFQPFAGNQSYRSLPPPLLESVVQELRSLPWPVHLVTRSYVRRPHAGKPIHELEDARRFHGGNITVHEHLSVPATLNLVRRCRAYAGSFSSLTQAAWFEHRPVLLLHPPGQKEITEAPGKGYAFGLHRPDCLAMDYEHADMASLRAFFMPGSGAGPPT